MATMRETVRMSERGSGMLLGAGIMLAGVVLGVAVFGEGGTGAFADAGGPKASLALPAITMAPSEVALVSDRAGRYMMIDTRGNAAPILIKDTQLRTGPGETFVLAP